MKTTLIKLNATTDVDLSKFIDSRALVQANSGGGKSWILRRLLEQSHGKVQQIVIDPEGEFSTLREKFDYVLAGKGGDTPATPQSAALLAKKLLEMNVSAIIDLYELNPTDRKRFVRLFLESMVNAPKELWHPVMVVIDEAHIFCPERGEGESEASEAVIDLCSRGRKRGYCAVLATQRLAKLNKNAAAECNNKLIGRCGLDTDMKRAAAELGFSSKEQYISLRQLDPGEFFVFGPALTKQVEKIKVGDIKTTHPKAGSRSFTKTVPPTAAIKKVLGQLADLPAEAKKEAMTLQELKAEITTLTRENRTLKSGPTKNDPAAIERAVKAAELQKDREYDKERNEMIKQTTNFLKIITEIGKIVSPFLKEKFIVPDFRSRAKSYMPAPVMKDEPLRGIRPDTVIFDEANHIEITGKDIGSMNAGEKKVLIAIAGDVEGITRDHLTVLVGYKTTSRNEYIRRLKMRGYIAIEGERIVATQEGIEALGNDYKELPTGQELQDLHMRTLPEGERKILALLIEAHDTNVDGVMSREDIGIATGYKTTSRNEYLRRLIARKLVTITRNGLVEASAKLF